VAGALGPEHARGHGHAIAAVADDDGVGVDGVGDGARQAVVVDGALIVALVL